MDEGSLCNLVKSELADYEFYFEDSTSRNNISSECQDCCAASQSPQGHKINDIQSFSSTPNQTSLDLVPIYSTIIDLENFLETSVIRYTQKMLIIDPYLGGKIYSNDYEFPSTLEMIYNVFKRNLSKYDKMWKSKSPEFLIHTPDTWNLQENLSSKKYVRINSYSCEPSQFLHDRFLKTEYILTQWGVGFDVFDSRDIKRASGITVIDKQRFAKYRQSLANLKRRRY